MYRNYVRENSYKVGANQSKMVDKNVSQSDGIPSSDRAIFQNGLDSDLEAEESIEGLNNEVNTEHRKRKLVLHFDIRNTVLVADSITNVSVEQALNSFLTGVAWGYEGSKGEWQWYSDELSLTPPAPNTTTFYKHLEKQFVKNTNDRTKLRLATGDFTQSEIGSKFFHHFKNHLELLKWRHEFVLEKHDILTMWGKDGQQYNYILPAVYKLVHSLVKDDRDFAIVFRTFGLDAPNVIKSLSYGLQGNHPGYPEVVKLPVNYDVGTVKRSDDEQTVFTLLGDSNSNEASQTFTGDRQIYDMLSQRIGIFGFRDDVNYWLENGYHHSKAKPLIIDPDDLTVHHIFFDDNIRTFEDDSIVDVRIFEKTGAKFARSLSKAEVGQFENVCIVQADLIRCIDDENYYVDLVKECELNYGKFLHRWKMFKRSVSHHY